MGFHLVQNRKENCRHDHIPLNPGITAAIRRTAVREAGGVKLRTPLKDPRIEGFEGSP